MGEGSRAQSGPVTRTTETYRVLHSGSQEVTVAAAALHGGVGLSCKQVIVQAHPDNAQRVLVGNQYRQDIILVPGQSETIPVCNVSTVYVRAVAGTQIANWHAVEL